MMARETGEPSMTHLFRTSRVATAVFVALALSAQVVARDNSTANAQTHWDAIQKCAAIQNDDSRHECSDNVLRDAGLMPPREEARRKSFGLQRPPAPREAPLPTPADTSDQLEVTLAAVKEGGDGRLVLTTTDGAIWRQVESEPIRPTPAQGQTMRITKASLGSYLCKTGKWGAFRCARAR
jgi:hypothetical protein